MKRAVLVIALAVSLAILVAAVLWQPGGTEPTGPRTGLDVVVIGVDSMDWFVLRGLLEEGEVPSIASLLTRGLTGEVTADMPPLPEVGWTTAGRGRGLTEDELDRVRSTDGRLFGHTPALARLVEASGGKTVTVGWPASWPADEESGLVVAPYRPTSAVHETGLPAAILGGDPGACHDSMRARVDELVRRNEEMLDAEFRRLIFDGESEGMWTEHLEAARWAFLSDLVTIDAAASLMAEESPDLTLVCLGGLDAISHRFLAPAMPSFFSDAPAEYADYADVLKNYYRFVDSCVERLRRLTDEDTIIIVVSTYGLHPYADVPGVSGSHVNGPPGVLVVRGSDIARRPQALSLVTADLAPTILATLGVTIPTEMDGRVLQEMMPVGLTGRFPLSYGGTIDASGVDPGEDRTSAADELVARRLSLLRGDSTD